MQTQKGQKTQIFLAYIIRLLLLQVAVASSSFPSYYGGARNHPKVFTQYPVMNNAGGQALAAQPQQGQQGIQSLAASPECGSV